MLHTFTINTLRDNALELLRRECWTLYNIELLSNPATAELALRVTTPDRGIWEWNEEIIPLHTWVGQQMGGDPVEAASTEWISYCEACGTEYTDDIANGDCDDGR